MFHLEHILTGPGRSHIPIMMLAMYVVWKSWPRWGTLQSASSPLEEERSGVAVLLPAPLCNNSWLMVRKVGKIFRGDKGQAGEATADMPLHRSECLG